MQKNLDVEGKLTRGYSSPRRNVDSSGTNISPFLSITSKQIGATLSSPVDLKSSQIYCLRLHSSCHDSEGSVALMSLVLV